MKKILFALLLFAIPSPAIAIEPINYPANFIEWRGVVYNLDRLAGRGVAPVAQSTQVTTSTSSSPTSYIPSDAQVAADRAVRDQKNRDAFEGARRAIQLEYLQNQR